jgi:hypothetical protein
VQKPDHREPLLVAIQELRELEQETRRHPFRSAPYLASAERLEEKAREVFRIGDDEPDWGGWEEPVEPVEE